MPGETGSGTEGPEISKGPRTDLKDTIKERGDAPGDEERAGEASQRARAGEGAGGGRVRDVLEVQRRKRRWWRHGGHQW